MAACFPVYGPGTARSFAKKLWNAIKLEVNTIISVLSMN